MYQFRVEVVFGEHKLQEEIYLLAGFARLGHLQYDWKHRPNFQAVLNLEIFNGKVVLRGLVCFGRFQLYSIHLNCNYFLPDFLLISNQTDQNSWNFTNKLSFLNFIIALREVH